MFFGRGKNKISNPITMPEIYEEYKKDIRFNEELYMVDYNTFCGIWKDYIKNMIEEILFKGQKMTLYWGVGELQVIKKQLTEKNSSIDWVETNRHGKVIKHSNLHSGQYKYTIAWRKLDSLLKHKFFYRFIPTRDVKRRLAFIIKKEKRDFFKY